MALFCNLFFRIEAGADAFFFDLKLVLDYAARTVAGTVFFFIFQKPFGQPFKQAAVGIDLEPVFFGVIFILFDRFLDFFLHSC